MGSGCVTAPEPPAALAVELTAPAQVRSIRLQITGQGIRDSIVALLSVGPDFVARYTIEVPAGAERRIAVLAADAQGVSTHTADVTLRLRPGRKNPPLRVALTAATERTVVVSRGSRGWEVLVGVTVTPVPAGMRMVNPSERKR